MEKPIPKLNKLTYPMGQYFGRIGGSLSHTHTHTLKVRWGSQLSLGLMAQVEYIMDKCWSKIHVSNVLVIPIHIVYPSNYCTPNC